jgi:hypothetical protein
MKRELLAILAIGGVGVAFATISALVWTTRGRNSRLIRRKLALGATLLTLTGSAAGCGKERVTCYAPPPPNQIELTGGSLVEVDLQGDRVVHGEITACSGQDFSFQIADASNVEQQRGPLVPTDGAFDESIEAFTLEVSADLMPGDYRLAFFALDAEEIGDGADPLRAATLRVIAE